MLSPNRQSFEALTHGVGVSRPLGDERHDLILDLRPELLRVQCKWAARVGDVVVVRTRRGRRGRAGQAAGIWWARDFELGATLSRFGGPIAQLGERLHGMQEVGGSIPPGSTFEAP